MPQLHHRQPQSNVELTKQGVEGACFVEAHFVDELLENKGIVGKQVNAPFPIVESDRAGNHLPDLAGVAASDETVIMHHAAAVADGFRIPVVRLAAFLIHRIEAEVLMGRNLGPQPRLHGLPLLFHLFPFGLLPLLATGFNALLL